MKCSVTREKGKTWPRRTVELLVKTGGGMDLEMFTPKMSKKSLVFNGMWEVICTPPTPPSLWLSLGWASHVFKKTTITH